MFENEAFLLNKNNNKKIIEAVCHKFNEHDLRTVTAAGDANI